MSATKHAGSGQAASEIAPKAAVSACLFRGSSVLLVERGKPPYTGLWSPPGGSIEAGETAAEAALREVAEETGLSGRLHGVCGVNDVILRDDADRLTGHYVILVFAGTAGDGEPVAASDAAAARFIELDALDAYRTGSRIRRLIAAAWTMHKAAIGA